MGGILPGALRQNFVVCLNLTICVVRIALLHPTALDPDNTYLTDSGIPISLIPVFVFRSIIQVKLYQRPVLAKLSAARFDMA
jgi:hypothetical protein